MKKFHAIITAGTALGPMASAPVGAEGWHGAVDAGPGNLS